MRESSCVATCHIFYKFIIVYDIHLYKLIASKLITLHIYQCKSKIVLNCIS